MSQNQSSDNKNVVLVMGAPNQGKSSSLYFLDHPEKYVYLNADKKQTPFRSRFMATIEVEDPVDVLDFIDEIEENEEVEGVIIDTITHLMDMFETQYIADAADSRKMWGEYAHFYKKLIHKAKSGAKSYIVLAHEDIFLNEKTNQLEAKVPVKGAIGRVGIEADFTTIVSAKTVEVKKLKDVQNDLLDVSPEDEEDGAKRVFVTRVTKDHSGGKMRSAMGLWDRSELYIDNNIQHVLDRLDQYYND